ncbi:MAG: exonuclease domain-containing protein [bacterium]|nr:exonuclease domain-containing protein [bacterium]
MKFAKDILIIDFEGRKHPVQIGAVLLDKETLEEKDSFVSYIYADLEGVPVKKSGITQEMINDAPRPTGVGKMVYEKFGSDIFLASFVQNLDIAHFRTMMAAAKIDFMESDTSFKKYDFHILDIWPAAYIHALKNGYTGGTGSEELFQYFGAKPRGLHNALEDCRITADVLRKIVS